MAAKFQQNLASFSGRILLIVFLVLSLVLVTVYSREDTDGVLHRVQGAVSGASSPIKFIGGALNAGTNAVGAAIENTTASEETLESLRQYNAQLIDEIAQLEEYRQEAQRLEALLGLKDNYNLDTVGARVIGKSANSYEKIITVDKGSSDGISAGLTVMGTGGVVGQVISVSPFSSEVRLLTDPQSGVAVMVQSTRSEGIVYGSLEGLLYLENLEDDAVVQVGDVIVTSGLGGSYNRGLTIGMVVKVEENQGGSTRKIVVSLNGSTDSLQEVLVVIGMNSEGDAYKNQQVGPAEGDSSSGS